MDLLVSSWNFAIGYTDKIIEYTYNHFTLLLTVIAISIVMWVSVGIIINRYERLAGPVIGLGNLLFCVPSISFFGIFITIPALGLGRTSATLALVIYSMMPLVRNVYRGLKSVDKSVLEVGEGMGMSKYQIMTKIQLPIALPVIFAGVRVTVVMVTGIATMATYIGERNLGRLLHHGIARSNAEMIITGAVIVSIIALLLDYIFGKIEEKLTPPGLRYRS